MEKLSTALKCIQEGMLKNNPQPLKMSVGEAAEVLGSLVNTHKHVIERVVEFQKELESHFITRKMGVLRRLRSASLRDTPISLKTGEKRVAPSPPEKRKFKKGKGNTSSSYATVTRSWPPTEEGKWHLVQNKEKKRVRRFRRTGKRFPFRRHRKKRKKTMPKRSPPARSGDAGVCEGRPVLRRHLEGNKGKC